MAEWFTSLLNMLLGGPATALLNAIGVPPGDPSHPITESFAMQILVVLIIITLLGIVRAGLSADKPGKLQQILELVYDGLGGLAEEIIGHGAQAFVPLLFTLALFIFLCNIIGLVPTLESPTGIYDPDASFPMMGIYTTLGCALVAL